MTRSVKVTVQQRRPPFDHEIARALEQQADAVVTSMTREDIPRIRAFGADIATVRAEPHPAFERAEIVVPGQSEDPDVPVVVLTPAGATEPVPTVLFLHGGGMVAGTGVSDLDVISELAHETGCAVVSVDYRLAPENPYPAALTDALTALRWLTAGAGPALLDSQRVIVGGISAGGGLAASTALHWRDYNGVPLTALLLMYPMLDHRSNSASATQMLGVGSWDASANAVAWDVYLAGANPDGYASPALNDNVAGLPPTFIDVGSAETFRDECVDFASRMWSQGGDTELHVWPGGAHAFDALAPWAHISKAARAARVTWLRRLLARE